MIEENLLGFLEDFGVTATYQSQEILVIFDEYFESGLELEGRTVMVLTRSEDVKEARHSDLIYIDSISYQIVGIRPVMDGKFTELDLKYE